MSAKSLEQLKAQFPGRVALRADEVALVLRGRTTRKVVERIRNNMKQGTYGSGARQIDGLWQLPLEDLAEVVEPTPKGPTEIPRPPEPDTKTRKRRKGTLGPRMFPYDQARFWGEVFRNMGDVRLSHRLSRLVDQWAWQEEQQRREKEAQETRQHLLDAVVENTPTQKRIL